MATPVCHRCGGPHLATSCRFIKEKCRSCGKIGHIAKVCQSKPSTTPAATGSQRGKIQSNKTHTVTADPSTPTTSSSPEESYAMFNVNSESAMKPITVQVLLNDLYPLQMEVDTGAAVSVISEDTYTVNFKVFNLQP